MNDEVESIKATLKDSLYDKEGQSITIGEWLRRMVDADYRVIARDDLGEYQVRHCTLQEALGGHQEAIKHTKEKMETNERE